MKTELYKEDWKRLIESMEATIKHCEREIIVNTAFLKKARQKMKSAEKDPNIIDLGDAKVRLPTGVG